MSDDDSNVAIQWALFILTIPIVIMSRHPRLILSWLAVCPIMLAITALLIGDKWLSKTGRVFEVGKTGRWLERRTIGGFSTDMITIGDEFRSSMKSGKVGSFIVIDKQQNTAGSQHDYFCVNVKLIGYVKN